MIIKLKKNGEIQEFTIGYVNMMTVRKAMEIHEKIEKKQMDLSRPTPTQLDSIIDFVVEAFDKQFTRDDLYQGWPAVGFVTRLVKVINDILDILLNPVEDALSE